jgi:hypothetical protein
MTTPTWQPGTLYSPGAVVRRNSVPAVVALAPTNADFESGDTGWTKEAGWTIETGGSHFSGDWAARYTGVTGTAAIYNSTLNVALPGLSITASCMVNQGASDSGDAAGKVFLEWLDASFVSLRIDDGNNINSGSNGQYKKSTVTATAPATTAYVRIGALCRLESASKSVWVDTFVWDYAYQPEQDGLIFRAVQASPGYSGGTEPTWPAVLGVQVVDNEVTWEAIDSSFVTWEATPILVSGATEPDFPLGIAETVADNTIVWEAISRRVEDVKCPNGPIVVTGASKIFCGDDDIIAFSATTNPLDWSTVDDAGYLPFGLQTYGANPVAAMGLYRGNLVAFNATGFQMWQIDEDPASMALLDAVPVACTEHGSLQPYQNDLVFQSAVGVRNMGIAGASTNLQAGQTGEPIDPLVRVEARSGLFIPSSAFLPPYGQYWLIFGAQAFVLTSNGAKSQRWSRYEFPDALTDWTQQGNDTYLRTASGYIWLLDDEETADDVYCQPTPPVLYGETYGDTLEVTLEWDPAEYETEIVSYLILRAVDSSYYTLLATVAGDVLTYVDDTVEAGSSYSYVVVARPDETGIDSEPSNAVGFEFDAEGEVEPEPPEPEPGDGTDCFDLYTKEVDTVRVEADGRAIDPELQFETEANKTYWMYGLLIFTQTDPSQSPGAQASFSHAGETLAFQQMAGAALAFQPEVTGGAAFIPMNPVSMDSAGYNARHTPEPLYKFQVLIDAILVVGDTGGTFGINWGILNAGSGSTALLAGSYITTIEVTPS